ncbi:protein kinase [Streptomyces sp. NPDC060035]|uniref:serine/threonine-protein kinase n=1 Tax=Streptomyces sp. NPDC060035 TaxID=3347044 RepID=UPI00369DF776
MDGEDGFDLAGSGAEPLRAQDPRRIGPIPLVGRIGAGGMGRVYLGVTGGRYAAVKQMLASVVAEDEGFVRRFGQEMDNLARLPAEATAPLLASDRTAEPPWFATAYVPGITLAEAVEPQGGPSPSSPPSSSGGGAIPADALWLLLREVAEGLKPVHALDMVHRDLKPSNVMLTLDGVTLIDFGIARAAEQSQLTRTGLIVGTPAYMSPEQATGARRLTPASDVFALGLLVGYAASGRWPFGDGAEGSPLYRIVHDEPDLAPVRERDARLAEVVASCLDKDPEGRPTVAELAELATQQGSSAPGGWPAAVMDQLVQRAAFAARVPKGIESYGPVAPGTVPAPSEGAGDTSGTAGAGDSEDAPHAAPDARPPRRERRRTRILLAVVPVVVTTVGTTLAIQNLPYATGPDHAAGSTPSVSVTAPADPTQSSGASASAMPTSVKPKKPEGKGTSSPDAGAGSGGSGGGAQDTAGGGDGPGGSGSSGNSGSSSPGGGGSSGSGTSVSSTGGGAPVTPPSSGAFRLKNADNGSCLIQVYGAADDGNCTDPSASWTTVSAENNSFKVVNEQSRACLVANMLGQAVFVGDCTQGAARLWRWGSGGTLKSVPNGGCLDLAYGGGVATTTCASGKASQNWRKS